MSTVLSLHERGFERAAPPKWASRGACAGSALSGDRDFFSPERAEVRACKLICQECPVRRTCLEHALEQHELYGIWGGADEHELRRALGVDANGVPMTRSRAPRCPNCHGRKLTQTRKRRRVEVTCTECDLSWRTVI